MNFDLGTLAGVLGVLLTIVFFIVGYRQTIGARKERAAAAGRDIAETLLRRLTLEKDFLISRDEIDRFVSGKALENRVKRSDVYSMDELWILLYSRLVSSDYVSAKQRKALLEKINKCFKVPSFEIAPLTTITDGAAQQEKKDERQFIYLGVVSTIMVAASVAFIEKFVALLSDRGSGLIGIPVLVATAVSVATAAALVLFYLLRERASAVRPEPEDISTAENAADFERRFSQRLKAIGVQFSTSQRDVDLILNMRGKRVAVELKSFLPPPRTIFREFKRLAEALSRLECDEAYIVIGRKVPDTLRDLNTDKIKIVDADAFLAMITEPQAVRSSSPSVA